MVQFNHPWLEFLFDYWPILIMIPTLLLMIAGLAYLTRWWDRRDAARVEELTPRAHFGAGSPT